jgi:DNA-binding XRE family transcriptional regulator
LIDAVAATTTSAINTMARSCASPNSNSDWRKMMKRHERLARDIRLTLSARVREYRAGLPQTRLAERAGVSLNTIGAIERGIRFPSPTVLARLCLALDCEPFQLFV